jgi:proteasome assembly chaperone (PAC2) family protein
MSEERRPVFLSRPKLRDPFIVCGVDGWVNSGEVAVGGIQYLIKQLKASKFAEMPASPYHVYQISGAQSPSPVFRMQEGLIVDTHLPGNEFFFALNPVSDHDLIIFLGTEPNLSWEEFADNVVGLACEFKAARLYVLGGLLDKTPYTREPMMTCTCTGQKVKDEMEQYNVLFSNREGPATFNQMLLYACKKKGLEGAGFTVRVPYYPEFNVAVGYSPFSIKAVLVRLNHMLHLDLSFDELNSAVSDLQAKLDVIRQQNQQFNNYIEDLEKEFVEMPYKEPLDISPSEVIKFAEQFLKDNKDQHEG